jgi:hypothetical protein
VDRGLPAELKSDEEEATMKRLMSALLTAGLTLALAGAASAGEKCVKEAQSVCAKGVGEYVCCKTFVLGHCLNVKCCEVGNHDFFTSSRCTPCDAHVMASFMKNGDSLCSTGSCDSTAVAGNAAFFTQAAPPVRTTKRAGAAKTARR